MQLGGRINRLYSYRTVFKSHVTFRTGGAAVGPRLGDVCVTEGPTFLSCPTDTGIKDLTQWSAPGKAPRPTSLLRATAGSTSSIIGGK